jgi:DNA repair exonuclease SbcCD ATPase subunit
MKLKKLALRYFKGIKDFTIDEVAECNNLSILGANGSGKTTIMDAITWLLFDKDSLGRKDFEIKTLDTSGEALHNLEHSVEAVFVNGAEVTLKKVYQEKYPKKRGSLESEFTGHTTDYYIDDVPVKLKEYQEKVAEIGGNETRFRLLTSPTAFASLKWQDQRQILIDAFGDVTDEDVISQNKELSGLPEILGGKTCEDYKKILVARRKKINDDIEAIPARIDEAQRSKPESLQITNTQAVITKLTKLGKQAEEKQQEIADIKAGGGIVELQKRLAVQEETLRQIKIKHEDDTLAGVRKLKADLSEKTDTITDLSREIVGIKGDIAGKQELLKNYEEANDSLRDQYKSVAAEKFDGDICPTCEQELPAEQRQEARNRWNVTQSKRKEEINAKGKANKEKIAVLNGEISVLTEKLTSLEIKYTELEKEIAGLKKQIENQSSSGPAITDLPEYQEAKREADSIQQEIDSIRSGNTAKTDEADRELAAIREQIAEQNKFLAAIEASQKQDTRITELKAEEKKLSAEYMRLSKHLDLIDIFTRTKVSMLDERISSQFELVKFKLSKEQINGGVADVCEMTVGGVPYGSLNNAARIQGGLDIIRTLSAHYGFRPLVIIDNRESVTEIPEMDTQVISLVVDPAYSELHIQ